ncbi:TPA: hypothetical protein K8C06_003747 [Salmonella enterica subsp. enterica serovar Welikade]|nr:hypothetical protein [Salmonella enterica subsp. diarizonae]EEG2848723.1 hypothetical protein [Salmonella enterica]EEH1295221.1 hypothetical protein [Salmonella enterica]EHZ8203390.1 hypothetical protein [Salmonella enterica]HBI5523318.1 hypothetical protein [Salmonella enterica subsp. enterica serovar Welikade]
MNNSSAFSLLYDKNPLCLKKGQRVVLFSSFQLFPEEVNDKTGDQHNQAKGSELCRSTESLRGGVCFS